jgi:GT2 family glycosyltransferase
LVTHDDVAKVQMPSLITPKIRFLHMPKTGGSWATLALSKAGVATAPLHLELPSHRGERGRSHEDLEDTQSYSELFTVAFVRHPLDWWRSYWCHRMTYGWLDDHVVDGYARSDSFEKFIAEVIDHAPGFLSNEFEYYVGPAENPITFIGRYERLAEDLCTALTRAGEKFDRAAIVNLAPENVGDYARFEANYPSDLAAALLRSEHKAMERFYSGSPQHEAVPEILAGEGEDQNDYKAAAAWFSQTLASERSEVIRLRGALEITAAKPRVTVMILSRRAPQMLSECLMSILRSRQNTPYEVLLLLNGADPEAQTYIETANLNIRWFTSDVNLGFQAGHNFLARHALGQDFLLLNDDAVVEDHWIDHLVDTLDRHQDCAIVGSRILFPDGRLQEAGSIIWSDATTAPVGRGADGSEPEYLYERQVDYVSFCSALIRREFWETAEGLDPRYFPAYYEDADLALVAAQRGLTVWYQPESAIRHHESQSASTDFKSFLFGRNRAQFAAKWGEQLGEFPAPNPHKPAAIRFAREKSRKFPPHVLVVDDRIPDPGAGSGYSRQLSMLQELAGAGLAVSLYTTAGVPGDPLEVGRFGVEVLDPTTRLTAHLTSGRRYDAAMISRPHNWANWAKDIRRFQPQAKLVYDAEALWHFRLRGQRELGLGWVEGLHKEIEYFEDLERRIASEADQVVAISAQEAQFFADSGAGDRVSLAPPIDPSAVLGGPGPQVRRGALFVSGWAAGAQSPNGDALRWLVGEVVPLVVAELPWFELTVSGGDVPTELLALAGPNVRFSGHLEDLAQAHYSTRLAVVPVRFGAGVKIKAVLALQYGTPVVSTSHGILGVPLHDGSEVDVADDPADFAAAIVRLMCDDAYWIQKRENVVRVSNLWAELASPNWHEILGIRTSRAVDRGSK